MNQKTTKMVGSALLTLALGSGVMSTGNEACAAVNAAPATVTINEVTGMQINQENYDRLKAQLDELEATYNLVWAEYMAVAHVMGNDWARTYGNQFGGIQGAINSMKGWLEQQYAATALTANSEIENYENIQSQLASLQSTMEQTIINQAARVILPDLSATVSTTMGSAIGTLQAKLNELGVAENYTDRINALLAKKAEAQTKLDEATAAITAAMQAKDYVAMITAAVEARTAIYQIRDEILAEVAAIESELLLADFMAQIGELETTLATVMAEFQAVAPVMGNDWARTYGNQFSGIQGAIGGMKGTVSAAYQAGTLTEDYVIENYENIQSQLASLQSTMEQTIINQAARVILPDLSSTVSTTMGSAIGTLQAKLNELGVAENYTDRVNALLAKKAEAQTKLDEATAAITAAMQAKDYVAMITAAVEAKTAIYEIRDEILAEIAAIEGELLLAGFMAQIGELETTLATVMAEFQAVAPVMGNDWARTYGNQFSGIAGAINGMKGTVSAAYQAGTLTKDYVIENYEIIQGQLASLQSTMEQTIINQAARVILPDLSSTVNTTMGSAIGNLQNQLNELGNDVAAQYVDRVNALVTKKNEAQTTLNEATAAITAAMQAKDYVAMINAAVEARTAIYQIRDEILAECEAILAEAQATVGISAINADVFAKGQVYDMNGRRVLNPTKGMFIINGKKVVIR